jgi:hypothetical protein
MLEPLGDAESVRVPQVLNQLSFAARIGFYHILILLPTY